MLNNKILLLSDSIALPRVRPEKVTFEETYPNLLRQKGFKIHQVSIGGATSTTLLSQLHYHIHFSPDIVILQVGIVDCAPRFANKYEIFIIRVCL